MCGRILYRGQRVWAFWKPGVAAVNAPLLPWTEAINDPGAGQMIHGRRRIESRLFLTRIPDDSVIVTDRVATSVSWAGTRRFVATRDSAGTYAMAYAPIGRPFKVKTAAVKGETVSAWWFNPRAGEATSIGEYPNTCGREFTHPDKGELLDRVLVLDVAAKKYPLPGKRK
ncbi:MAG: putative collagen-binding domain-containing protein [Gemmataceae bacterium]